MSKPKTTEAEKVKDFAIARSHKASEIAYDLCKAISQTALLINGGAATAIVTYFSKETVEASIYKAATVSLVIYGVGVLASVLMMFCIMQTADWWNYFWYAEVSGDGDSESLEIRANRWHKGYYVAFWFAMGSFMVASVIISYAS